MQNIFYETASLDQRCYDDFHLSEDILMEHAASGIADFIKQNFSKNSRILISCGASNNGADGMAAARMLDKDYQVFVHLFKQPKSDMAKLQFKRLESLGILFTKQICEADVVVDAIIGTGLKNPLNSETALHVRALNELKGVKIACDVPTGLRVDGKCSEDVFKAHHTLSMGALKESFFSDSAKDAVGKISVIDLGVSRKTYETPSLTKLLELSDFKPPVRDMQNTHKGNFGHLSVLVGEKQGAGVFCAKAAFRFGAALVTLVASHKIAVPYELMIGKKIPAKTTAIALGMGLGIDFDADKLNVLLDHNLPLLLDADIFYHKMMPALLQRENIVLTPHPKEFIFLLHVSGIADITVNKLQSNRFFYARAFAKKFKNAVLVLKGANVLIAQDDKLFVNVHGTNVLAKGGSGDVLSGLIASLLAQGYAPLQAAINGSLAHVKLALGYDGSSFSLSPEDLIGGIKYL